MKKLVLLWLGSLLMALAALVIVPGNKADAYGDSVIFVDLQPNESSVEEIYQKIVYSFLEPCIHEVLADYYQRPIRYSRRNVKVLSIERPNSGGTFYFLLKLEVCQYTGPYDKIGIDHLTLETAGRRGLRALEYRHTEGFDFHNEVEREPLKENDQEESPEWPADTNDGLYRDLAMLFLTPYIDEAIKDYYGHYFAHDPWSDRVLELRSLKEKGKPFCIIKLKVIPYTGPHNSVGIDNITLSIDAGPKVRIEKFDHLKDHQWQIKPKSSTQDTKIKQAIFYITRLLFSF